MTVAYKQLTILSSTPLSDYTYYNNPVPFTMYQQLSPATFFSFNKCFSDANWFL